MGFSCAFSHDDRGKVRKALTWPLSSEICHLAWQNLEGAFWGWVGVGSVQIFHPCIQFIRLLARIYKFGQSIFMCVHVFLSVV